MALGILKTFKQFSRIMKTNIILAIAHIWKKYNYILVLLRTQARSIRGARGGGWPPLFCAAKIFFKIYIQKIEKPWSCSPLLLWDHIKHWIENKEIKSEIKVKSQDFLYESAPPFKNNATCLHIDIDILK